MIEFSRSKKPMRQLPLTPLIDVVFILIVFFMLTTSFVKIESIELLLPGASQAKAKKAEKAYMARIFIHNDGRVMFGKREIAEDELQATLVELFERNPETRVMLFTAEQVSMQRLVGIMDMVYRTGGKSLFVKDWVDAG